MKKTELKLRIYGDKALRRKSTPVKTIGRQERDILEEMAKVMYANGGVGLAAPQVGINKQIIICDVGKGLCKLINPKINKRQGSCFMQEGCLSLPGVSINVKRPKKVFVQALDEFNNKLAFWAQDLLARVIQHEIDHLKGRLIVDYVNLIQRIKLRRVFKRNQKLNKKL
jgi:peptide deformylase